MPEGLEAEIYRRAIEPVVGRDIVAIEVDDHQAMAVELGRVLPGRRIVGARRRGKHVLVDLDDDHVLGLHFGMTGRLIVDGAAAIDRLEYASGRDDPAWNRLVVTLADGEVVRVNDPRRWAVFTLDPDLSRLGPDFLTLTIDVVRDRLAGRRAALKAILLDQSVIAGFGNMCVDEVLWQAGVSPLTPAGSLDDELLGRLVEAAGEHLPAMLERGGSHTGTIDPEVRASVPPCPRDGAAMRRDTVGGRTTIWCPVHQVG
ncbi:MAG: Fpg/Nei family DNA glycosylase [Ilumatobacter sp.]|nr:Fpg/Nei family DNA glycosylase [Ilumatobacter sp.]